MNVLTLTLAEAVLSQLVATGKLDETNPQLLRHYQEKAQTQLAISAVTFYTKQHHEDADGEFTELDRIIEWLFHGE